MMLDSLDPKAGVGALVLALVGAVLGGSALVSFSRSKTKAVYKRGAQVPQQQQHNYFYPTPGPSLATVALGAVAAIALLAAAAAGAVYLTSRPDPTPGGPPSKQINAPVTERCTGTNVNKAACTAASAVAASAESDSVVSIGELPYDANSRYTFGCYRRGTSVDGVVEPADVSRWAVTFSSGQTLAVTVNDLRKTSARELWDRLRVETEYCASHVEAFDWVNRDALPDLGDLQLRLSLIDRPDSPPSPCPTEIVKVQCRYEYVELGVANRVVHVHSYAPTTMFDEDQAFAFIERHARVVAKALGMPSR